MRNQLEIDWDSFSPTLQHLAAGNRVRPEFMLAYLTSALGGVSGAFSGIKGLIGDTRHPGLSLVAITASPSRGESLSATVVEPIRQLQDRSRISNRMVGSKVGRKDDTPLHPSHRNAYLFELNDDRTKSDPATRRAIEEYMAEERRCLNSSFMISPSPEGFTRLRKELLDGHGLVFDPRARILTGALADGKSSQPWRQLLTTICEGSGFGVEEGVDPRPSKFGSEFTLRSPFLFHVSPRRLEDWWGDRSLRQVTSSAVVLSIEKNFPMREDCLHLAENAAAVLKNVIWELTGRRISSKGQMLDCEFGQLEDRSFFRGIETFNDRLDDLPETFRSSTDGLLGLPLKLAWTAQLLESGTHGSIRRYTRSAITAANWCLDRHVEAIQKYEEMAERRQLIADARKIFVRIRQKAPCSYRDVYRGTNSQRRSDVEPIVEFLRGENLVSVRNNRIELVETDVLPDWLEEVSGSNLN